MPLGLWMTSECAVFQPILTLSIFSPLRQHWRRSANEMYSQSSKIPAWPQCKFRWLTTRDTIAIRQVPSWRYSKHNIQTFCYEVSHWILQAILSLSKRNSVLFQGPPGCSRYLSQYATILNLRSDQTHQYLCLYPNSDLLLRQKPDTLRKKWST